MYNTGKWEMGKGKGKRDSDTRHSRGKRSVVKFAFLNIRNSSVIDM